MTYRSTKWLILIIPTLTIGLWEYIRHKLLLPYLSMEAGNALAPVIVFLVTVTLVRKLFMVLEETRQELERERVSTASMKEREQLARELHDGISQSLFLVSVKLDMLDRAPLPDSAKHTSEQIRSTVKHIYEDVRQLIDNLQTPVAAADDSWLQSVGMLADELEQSGVMRIQLDLHMPDGVLSRKEKIELLAIIREAMFNAQKHAQAELLKVTCHLNGVKGFICKIEDDGIGIHPDRLNADGHYGIRMMQERADAMGWAFVLESPSVKSMEDGRESGTCVYVEARGGRHDF